MAAQHLRVRLRPSHDQNRVHMFVFEIQHLNLFYGRMKFDFRRVAFLMTYRHKTFTLVYFDCIYRPDATNRVNVSRVILITFG